MLIINGSISWNHLFREYMYMYMYTISTCNFPYPCSHKHPLPFPPSLSPSFPASHPPSHSHCPSSPAAETLSCDYHVTCIKPASTPHTPPSEGGRERNEHATSILSIAASDDVCVQLSIIPGAEATPPQPAPPTPSC